MQTNNRAPCSIIWLGVQRTCHQSTTTTQMRRLQCRQPHAKFHPTTHVKISQPLSDQHTPEGGLAWGRRRRQGDMQPVGGGSHREAGGLCGATKQMGGGNGTVPLASYPSPPHLFECYTSTIKCACAGLGVAASTLSPGSEISRDSVGHSEGAQYGERRQKKHQPRWQLLWQHIPPLGTQSPPATSQCAEIRAWCL